MKEKYSKLYGLDYYIKEIKKHWWLKWEIEKYCNILPVVYCRRNGEFIKIEITNKHENI